MADDNCYRSVDLNGICLTLRDLTTRSQRGQQFSSGDGWLDWIDYDNRWKNGLWQIVTGGTGEEDDKSLSRISSLNARIAYLEESVTDDPFTVDSTGWTVDTAQVKADMVKA